MDGSEWVRMGQNGSEWVRMGGNIVILKRTRYQSCGGGGVRDKCEMNDNPANLSVPLIIK